MNWEAVIGLETHVQLDTRSKIFSTASTAFGAPPNARACALDIAMPGVLPVLNEQVVVQALRFGLAIGAEIARVTVFERKNYFYPDLPKGYQISQMAHPIVGAGLLPVTMPGGEELRIRILRAHLEEDAGKSVHDRFPGMTGIDLNRAGVPLLEIVSAPDMRSAVEAGAYLRKIHSLVRYLGICDGNMQEGSLRCDANVSVRPAGETALGERTEIKNLNSFRFVEHAIRHEISRQIGVLEGGEPVVRETRLYDADRDETRAIRGKEEAQDYRYFPDPDLLPVQIDEELLEHVRATMPELPQVRQMRYQQQYRLPEKLAATLVEDPAMADYFEQASILCGEPLLTANWITQDLAAALNRSGLDITAAPVDSAALAELIGLLVAGDLSGKMAKDVFAAMWRGEGRAGHIMQARGLRQISDTKQLETLVDRVIADHPRQVRQYREGKSRVLGFFVGQVMKGTAGSANPRLVDTLLRTRLEDRP